MSRSRSSYSFDLDLMRIALIAVVLAVVVGVVLHLLGLSVVAAVVWAVIAGVLSTVLVGPVSGRRPARSNSSG